MYGFTALPTAAPSASWRGLTRGSLRLTSGFFCLSRAAGDESAQSGAALSKANPAQSISGGDSRVLSHSSSMPRVNASMIGAREAAMDGEA